MCIGYAFPLSLRFAESVVSQVLSVSVFLARLA